MNELTTTTGAELVTVSTQSPAHNPAAIYLASLSAGSRRTMRQALDVIADALASGNTADTYPWAAVRMQEAAALRTFLAEHYSPATANKMMSALRGVLKESAKLVRQAARASEDDELQKRARIVQDELADAIGNLERVKGGSEDPRGRALARGEIRSIFNACAKDPTPAGLRDAGMFALLYGCGLRRAELAGLDLADFTLDGDDNGTLVIRHGKGNKTRSIPVNDGALDALRDWLSARGDEPGPLFCAINRGGRMVVTEKHLTSQAVYNMLAKRGEQANVKDFSPHDMRRTFISDLLDEGADIATVQKLAGHANVTTTAKYDRRGERAKRKAVGLLHIPYKARRLPNS